MITTHWSFIVFIIVVYILIKNIIRSGGDSTGDYGIDVETPFYVILLIGFVLIWGGIFWW